MDRLVRSLIKPCASSEHEKKNLSKYIIHSDVVVN